MTVRVFGAAFQNPLILAAGTCGFGRELADVVDLEALGGLVTKSVTVEPRTGNPRPRVAELEHGMINSVGLANPGLDVVRKEKLPWLRDNLRRARVFVSVAGHNAADYQRVVSVLDGEEGFLGFELNLSCPNDLSRTGRPFVLDPEALARVVEGCRSATGRPLLVKLAPNDPDLARTVAVAEGAGADGLTLVNTLPGLALRSASGRPALGAGEGGISGPALRPAGVRAVMVARRVSSLPLVGVGGILHARDALEYFHAGASLVQVGTATFAAPRQAERLGRRLRRWLEGGQLPLVPAQGEAASAGETAVRSGAPDQQLLVSAEGPWHR